MCRLFLVMTIIENKVTLQTGEFIPQICSRLLFWCVWLVKQLQMCLTGGGGDLRWRHFRSDHNCTKKQVCTNVQKQKELNNIKIHMKNKNAKDPTVWSNLDQVNVPILLSATHRETRRPISWLVIVSILHSGCIHYSNINMNNFYLQTNQKTKNILPFFSYLVKTVYKTPLKSFIHGFCSQRRSRCQTHCSKFPLAFLNAFCTMYYLYYCYSFRVSVIFWEKRKSRI